VESEVAGTCFAAYPRGNKALPVCYFVGSASHFAFELCLFKDMNEPAWPIAEIGPKEWRADLENFPGAGEWVWECECQKNVTSVYVLKTPARRWGRTGVTVVL
jgi:hypothetical protein